MKQRYNLLKFSTFAAQKMSSKILGMAKIELQEIH